MLTNSTRKKIKTYSELMTFKTFSERVEYLKTNDRIGIETFGSSRYLNQSFYKSKEYLNVRDKVIARDRGCDLGIDGMEISSEDIIIHHINPITIYDIINKTEFLLNPEYLITTVLDTHNAIHYGGELKTYEIIERKINDTCPWKH